MAENRALKLSSTISDKVTLILFGNLEFKALKT